MSNYPEPMVAPMREELTRIGFTQLTQASDVDALFTKPGVTLLVVNSVCGCAAGGARPGVVEAVQNRGLHFDHLATVFAGMEKEATQRARDYFEGAAPSSPNAALFKDGKLVHLMPRSAFQDRSPSAIADELVEAYRKL